ncbi:uncharacterized protein LOC131161441 [Malania oleifera]|uniref:uncharacterized protein LOC131161441 n=1 Tax=Malania oleifera TaxID=397392 RepID=UPI0025AD9F23|nr:uncharacterized protein LOC131161441 [Malania oleifera]
MAQASRPLRQWLGWHQQCCSRATFNHFLSPYFTAFLPSRRDLHRRPGGLRLRDAPPPSDPQDGLGDSDLDVKRSRNEKKREARRAVRWGKELAAFPAPQIKRILRVASLEREVFDALMLAKRLGPDVREGKRRQFNYIGKLLRKAEPELMDALIQASKDGDQSQFQDISDSGARIAGNNDEEAEETKYEEGPYDYIDRATRWFEGLISKDIDITNEVYSVHSVEFDRQELRKLVRKVHSLKAQLVVQENEGEIEASLMSAKRSLTRFLHALAKQMPTE